MEPRNFTIPKEIQAIQAIADDIRPEISGVYFNGTMAVATNGKGMVLRDTSALPELPKNLILKFSSHKQAGAKLHGGETYNEVSPGRAIGVLSGKNEAREVASQFPNIKEVLPTFEAEKIVSVSLDVALLLEIAEAMSIESTHKTDKKFRAVTLTFERDSYHPILVSSLSSESLGVMMPLRPGKPIADVQATALERCSSFKK
jgi:hypothetical protein